ncbi:MAG: DUF4097 family beta strand repeat-containing protein [Anaerolineae bacterium]
MQNRTCLIILVVLALAGLLLLCVAAAVFGAIGFLVPGRTTVSETISTELPAVVPAVVEVRNEVGGVTIIPGPEGIIQVDATKEVRTRSRGRSQELLSAIQVRIDQVGGTTRVNVDLPQTRPSESSNVELTIRVPHRTDLDITNNVGDIEIQGVTGNMRVRSDVGSVTLDHVEVTNEADVQAGTGDVEFQGRLPQAEGQILLRSMVGSVEVRVPTDSRFALDAETQLGSIESDFVVDEAQSGDGSGGQLGHWLRGRVNGGLGVDLILRTNTGSIRLEPIE